MYQDLVVETEDAWIAIYGLCIPLLSLHRRAVWVCPSWMAEEMAWWLHCLKRNWLLPLPLLSWQTAPRQDSRCQEGFHASSRAPLRTLRRRAKTKWLVWQSALFSNHELQYSVFVPPVIHPTEGSTKLTPENATFWWWAWERQLCHLCLYQLCLR